MSFLLCRLERHSLSIFTATSEEIVTILDAVEPTLKQFPPDHVYIACLALAFIIMKPDITNSQVINGVTKINNWMTDFLSGVPADMAGIKFQKE